jgi:hypothetical protein
MPKGMCFLSTDFVFHSISSLSAKTSNNFIVTYVNSIFFFIFSFGFKILNDIMLGKE